MSNAALTSLSRRSNFSGKDDYYGNRFLSQVPSLHQQLLKSQGAAPSGLLGQVFSETSSSAVISRLNRYRAAWNFYRGDHWESPYEDGEHKPVLNFCKKIVDAGVDWFVAKGWKTTSVSGNEALAELVDACWASNNKMVLTEQSAQYGAVCGDSYFYVTLKEESLTADNFESAVQITVLNPAFCFPVFDPNTGQMTAFLYQYPIDRDGETVVSSLVITPEEWATYEGEKQTASGPNKFGEVNVVHIPNFVLADSVFGQNDIHQVMPLNEEYNIVLNSVRRVIKYHAEPTTLIFGVKAGDMERGAKKVWSNLPTDAKVENLQLEGDMEATTMYLDRLERMMGELSNTPRAMFDSKDLHLSNASGLVMQMMYQPIIDKTRKRQTNFRKGMKRVNRLILLAYELLGLPLEEWADKPESRLNTDVEFTSPLPRDEQAELDVAVKKIELRVWSRAEAMRRLSHVPDYRRLAMEIAADERHDLALKAEEQKAATNLPPNLTVPFLGSVFLSEDFEAVLAQTVSLEKSAADDEQAKIKAASVNPTPKSE
jgi:hypothetical protein